MTSKHMADKLTAFLYYLLQDHTQYGDMTYVIQELERSEATEFSLPDRELAALAAKLAKRLA